MPRLFRDITLVLTLLLCGVGGGWTASAAEGKLSGEARLGAASYKAEVNGEEAGTASHLYQQYTLLYSRRHSLLGGRGGNYALMLGYEHTVLDPASSLQGVDDADAASLTRNKLFYQGQLLLAPGGLPFRLTLAAEDIHRSSFNAAPDLPLPLGDTGTSSGHLINQDIYGDVNNGTRKVYAANLLVGIRNGSYLGAYRDILSQLPRLLVDYRQETVDDSESRFSPSKYRLRDLAFISLNKKSNWIHFRLRDYIDYFHPDSDSKETQVLIGSIDHQRRRDWINFTNWLKISTDGSYTVVKQANEEMPARTYAYNLFAIGQRPRQQVSIFSSFKRTQDRAGIAQTFELPMKADYEPDRNTRINTRLVFDGREDSAYAGMVTLPGSSAMEPNHEYDFLLETRADLNRSRPIVYRPHLQLERLVATASTSTAVKLGGEVASNNALAKASRWLAGADLSLSQGESGGAVSTFTQSDLFGRYEREVGRNWLLGTRANLSMGMGAAGAGSDSQRITQLSGGQVKDFDPLANDFDGAVVQGGLSLFAENRAGVWSNRVSIDDKFRLMAGERDEVITLEHALKREERQSILRWKSVVVVGGGESSLSQNLSSDYLQSTPTDKQAQLSWKSDIDYTLTPSRQLLMVYSAGINGSSEQTLYKLGQEVHYTLYTRNGIVRRLASCAEEFNYEWMGHGSGLERSGAARLKLSAAYYPTHSYYLLGTVEYVLLRPSSAVIYIVTTNTGFDFSKFKVNLSYSLGNKSEESISPEVTEQRWAVDIKKTF